MNQETKADDPLYFIDLFCGAGGLSSGLEMAGFECAFGTDFNIDAIETFNYNHKSATSFLGPIADLTEEILHKKIGDKKIKLIAGGPPCQGFSTIGKGDPSDAKNSLFIEYCRILKIINPEYFIFENVTGLVAKKNESVIHAILAEFKSLGHRVNIKILEAQHFGVPQKRKRTILFGTRLKKSLSFPLPKFDTTINEIYIPPINVEFALANLESNSGEIFNHDLTKSNISSAITEERLKHIPEGKGIRYKRDEDELLPEHLKMGVDWNTIREGRLRELHLYRLDNNLPSPTIQTQNPHYYHPNENRRFTMREIASIQSFPNDFKFFGSRGSINKQIGNAVPPLLGKALGEQLIKSFNEPDLSPEELKKPLDLAKIKYRAFTYSKPKGLQNYNKQRQASAKKATPKKNENSWASVVEKLAFNPEKISPKQYSAPIQTELDSEKILVVLEGKATLHQNNKTKEVVKGDVIHLQKNSSNQQIFYNHGDKDFHFISVSDK